MKFKKIILLAAAVMMSVANAANFSVSSLVQLDYGSTDRLVTSSTNTPLASGFAGTGTFNISDSAVASLIAANNYTALFAAFTPSLGTDNFQTGVNATTGLNSIPGAFAYNATLSPTPYVGATIYTFLGNGASLAASTALGLFKHNTVVTPDPANPPPNGYILGLADANGTLLVGTKGTAVVSNAQLGLTNVSIGTIQLVNLVPEPSAALLGLLGAFGLLRRRR